MTTKTEAASQVRKVLQLVKDRLATPGGGRVNEATTRAHFLNPLLGALGYQSIDDIEFEHYLPDGKTFLDYRLRIDGKPRVSVEAKGLEVRLSDKDAAQAVSYATILGDEWAVVTNAREWRLYHTFAQAPLHDKEILRADLVGWQTDAQFDDLFERLWLISKESFLTGEGPGSWVASQRLEQLLKKALVDPSSPEIKYIRKRLEAAGVPVTNDQLAGWLRLRLDASAPAPKPASSYPESDHVEPAYPSKEVEKPLVSAGNVGYWLIPAGKQGAFTAAQHLKAWLDRGFWGFWEKTPGRKSMKPGDWACFYAAKSKQVLAYGRVSGSLDTLVSDVEWPGPMPPTQPTYKVPLTDITWLTQPVALDAQTRASLDAFKGKELSAGWAWLVQTSHRLTKADFQRLTSQR